MLQLVPSMMRWLIWPCPAPPSSLLQIMFDGGEINWCFLSRLFVRARTFPCARFHLTAAHCAGRLHLQGSGLPQTNSFILLNGCVFPESVCMKLQKKKKKKRGEQGGRLGRKEDRRGRQNPLSKCSLSFPYAFVV